MKGCVLLGIDRPTQNPNFQMACSQGFQHPESGRGEPPMSLGVLGHHPCVGSSAFEPRGSLPVSGPGAES